MPTILISLTGRMVSVFMMSLFLLLCLLFPGRVSAQKASVSTPVDQCWKMKSGGIRKDELPAAKEANDHARKVYEQIIENAETLEK